MTLSIGIAFDKDNWKSCIMENGQTVELCSFDDSAAVLAYVERSCAYYPELTIVVSLGFESPFTPLHTITSLPMDKLHVEHSVIGIDNFLVALRAIDLNSYCVPSVKYLPGVPIHRKLIRPDLGASNSLCTVAALLYGLRKREAIWAEIRLLCVEVGQRMKSVLVVEDGRIVNGIGAILGGTDLRSRAQMNDVANYANMPIPEDYVATKRELLEHTVGQGNSHQVFDRAYWEGMAQELAGLIAIHHFEDIVVIGEYKEAFVERFADSYQVYLSPYHGLDEESYESALGAAIIAEGLYRPGLAAEVVERLQIREASYTSLEALAL